MKHIILTALVAAGLLAGTAQADYLKGDPRSCQYNTNGTRDHAATCAKMAAIQTTKAYLARTGKPSYYISCAMAGSLLKWDCTIAGGGASPVAHVWFRATSTGWKRIVTITG